LQTNSINAKTFGKTIYFEINKDERDYAKIELAKKDGGREIETRFCCKTNFKTIPTDEENNNI